MRSEVAAREATLQLREAQQTQSKLCHAWLDDFAKWIDSGSTVKTDWRELPVEVWAVNKMQQLLEMWKEDCEIQEYCWASWRLHCGQFMRALARRPRGVSRLPVGFDGQARARRSQQRRGRGQVQGRTRVRPSIVPKGWGSWMSYRGERQRQKYNMEQHEVMWVFAMEAPEEADWKSVEFSGVATFTVAEGQQAGRWRQIATSIDSMAMVNCVTRDTVRDDWFWESRGGSQVRGMEGQGVATSGRVRVPRWS